MSKTGGSDLRKDIYRKDIMLNEIENEKLIEDCQRCNLSYGEYFRRLLMNEQIKEKAWQRILCDNETAF